MAGAGRANNQPQVEPERLLLVVFTWASVAVLAGYGLLLKTRFPGLLPSSSSAAELEVARCWWSWPSGGCPWPREGRRAPSKRTPRNFVRTVTKSGTG